MRAPSSPAPRGSKAVPNWALAMLAQTIGKHCRNDEAAEHTKTRFLKNPQPVLLTAGQKGTSSSTEDERTVTRMQQQL